MTMSVEDYAASDDVDWNKDFIWVQETSLLKVLSRTAGTVHVIRHDGSAVTLSEFDAEQRYFPIRNGNYLKPRYAPIKAHVLSQDMVLSESGRAQTFREGSAIFSSANGYLAVHYDDLVRDYEAVSHRSVDAFPEAPFSNQ